MLVAPEGARDYFVSSKIDPESFYILPQSPQLFKQLLMVAGIDRYFQIATCFRDEDLSPDKQPEFSQIDLELSFGTPEDDLFPCIEELMKKTFKQILNIDIPMAFTRISYDECIEKYGSDRPDLRFPVQLVRLDEIVKESDYSIFLEQVNAGNLVKGMCVKGGASISRTEIDVYTNLVGELGIKDLVWMKVQEEGLSSSLVKFFSPRVQNRLIKAFKAEEGDHIFMVAENEELTNQGLDLLRRRVAKDYGLLDPNKYEFLWVTDLPLFTWSEKNQCIESKLHPFTSPQAEDLSLLSIDPLKIRSSGYDLVLNGQELGSGSQRINSSEVQEKVFEILKMSPQEIHERFGFLLDALQYGAPPHLGIALGFDRLIMSLTQTENIHDVIAFPKTQSASDLMLDVPTKEDTIF